MTLIIVAPAPAPFFWLMIILPDCDVVGCCHDSFCRVHLKILVMKAKSYGLFKKYSVMCSFLLTDFEPLSMGRLVYQCGAEIDLVTQLNNIWSTCNSPTVPKLRHSWCKFFGAVSAYELHYRGTFFVMHNRDGWVIGRGYLWKACRYASVVNCWQPTRTSSLSIALNSGPILGNICFDSICCLSTSKGGGI